MVPAAIQDMGQLLKMARQSGYDAKLLSKALKISPRQLRRYTHNFFGCSPQAWLDRQRLHLAGDLLKQHRCIKTVAFQLGYKRVSHFSREFKSCYGVCPSAYIVWNDHQTIPHTMEQQAPPQTDLTALLAEGLSRIAVNRPQPGPSLG